MYVYIRIYGIYDIYIIYIYICKEPTLIHENGTSKKN